MAQMAQAILLHLSYIQSVSDTKLLAESSIRYPLVEYAERRFRPAPVKIELEFSHPTFARRRCDLLMEETNSKNVFEFKYVREDTHNDFQEYFNDILRLHNLHALGFDTFFIVCGNSILFNMEFRNTRVGTLLLSTKKGRPSGIFSKCLSFSSNNPIKIIDTNKFKSNYSAFTSEYKFKKKGGSHPSNQLFETRLVFLKYDGSPQSIGVWEVL